MSNITELTVDTFSSYIAKGVSLVDYWAIWCGPCKMMAPVLEQIASELAGKVNVAKVNVDEQSSLAQDADVSAIPNLCIYKDGALVDRIIGVQPKDKVIQTLKKYM